MGRLKLAAFAALLTSSAAAQQCGTITTCPPVSTPLAGTELLYVVQASVSKKMTVTQLAADIGPLVPLSIGAPIAGGSAPNILVQLTNGLQDGSLGAHLSLSGLGALSTDATGSGILATKGDIPTSLPPNGAAGGDLTGSYPNPTIAANAVTNAKAAQMAADTLKGNNTGSTANAADLTDLQTKTLLGRLPISVADFAGADPTGATSSSAAFNSAVTQCLTMGGGTYPGCKIIVPAGQWLLSTTVTILGGNITIDCESHASLIVNGQTNAPAITFGNGSTAYFKNALYNCQFAEGSGLTAVSGNNGLNLLNQNQFYLADIQIGNFPAALYDGLVSNVSNSNFWRGIGVGNTLHDGVHIFSAGDINVAQSRSDANANDGWLFENDGGVYFSDVTAYNNSNDAYQFFYPGSGQHNDNFFFWDVVGDTSGSYNWNIGDLNQSSLTNVWGSTNQSKTVNTGAPGFILSTSNVHDVDFHGGKALNNNGSGVYVFNSGGMPTNLGFYGFDFGETASPNGQGSVSGYGLQVDSAATAINVLGGQSIANLTAPFSIGAAAAGVVIQNVMGYNPVGTTAAANVGASPATITAGSSPETHYIKQSATFNATIAKGGQTICGDTVAAVPCVVQLGPNESYVVTWTTTMPTYVKDVH